MGKQEQLSEMASNELAVIKGFLGEDMQTLITLREQHPHGTRLVVDILANQLFLDPETRLEALTLAANTLYRMVDGGIKIVDTDGLKAPEGSYQLLHEIRNKQPHGLILTSESMSFAPEGLRAMIDVNREVDYQDSNPTPPMSLRIFQPLEHLDGPPAITVVMETILNPDDSVARLQSGILIGKERRPRTPEPTITEMMALVSRTNATLPPFK